MHRVGDALQLLADRLMYCVTGDVAISCLVVERTIGEGDNDRPLEREGDNDDDKR